MFTTFTLLVAVGCGFRLALNWGLRRRFDLGLSVPQALASGLVVLAGLPDLIKPIAYPLPLSLTLGVLLPDFLFRRGSQ
nr:hypothetical protein [uncultured Shimia sp.]